MSKRGSMDALVSNELYIGYSRDEEIRDAAASGGIVSAVLIHLLERGEIDAALVSRIGRCDGTVGGLTELARTRAEVLACAGSSYIDTPVVREINALHDYAGRVAVVALPCQVRQLRGLLARDAVLSDKIYAIIALFCRGNVTARFYEDYFRRIGIDPAKVESVKVKRTHIKGTVTVRLQDAQVHTLSFQHMNAYRIAGCHAKPLCLWCDEHMGAEADISVGDIFAPGIKERAIKHSALICRTSRGVGIVEDMLRGDSLALEPFGLQRYRTLFAANEAFGNNLALRRWPARLTGVATAGLPPGRVNPFHVLAWLMYFLAFRITRSTLGRRLIYRLPRPLMSMWALFIPNFPDDTCGGVY